MSEQDERISSRLVSAVIGLRKKSDILDPSLLEAVLGIKPTNWRRVAGSLHVGVDDPLWFPCEMWLKRVGDAAALEIWISDADLTLETILAALNQELDLAATNVVRTTKGASITFQESPQERRLTFVFDLVDDAIFLNLVLVV